MAVCVLVWVDGHACQEKWIVLPAPLFGKLSSVCTNDFSWKVCVSQRKMLIFLLSREIYWIGVRVILVVTRLGRSHPCLCLVWIETETETDM